MAVLCLNFVKFKGWEEKCPVWDSLPAGLRSHTREDGGGDSDFPLDASHKLWRLKEVGAPWENG